MSKAVPDAMEWESPPPNTRGRYDWQKVADQLREHPGQWLKVWDVGRTSTVNAIRDNAVLPLRPVDGFEVTTRNNRRRDGDQPATCTLYLRFNPGGESDAAAGDD